MAKVKTSLSLVSLGCAKNAVDLQVMAGNLLKEGYLKKLKQAENAQMISELETEKAINDAEYHLRERIVPKSLLKKNYTNGLNIGKSSSVRAHIHLSPTLMANGHWC